MNQLPNGFKGLSGAGPSIKQAYTNNSFCISICPHLGTTCASRHLSFGPDKPRILSSRLMYPAARWPAYVMCDWMHANVRIFFWNDSIPNVWMEMVGLWTWNLLLQVHSLDACAWLSPWWRDRRWHCLEALRGWDLLGPPHTRRNSLGWHYPQGIHGLKSLGPLKG